MNKRPEETPAQPEDDIEIRKPRSVLWIE